MTIHVVERECEKSKFKFDTRLIIETHCCIKRCWYRTNIHMGPGGRNFTKHFPSHIRSVILQKLKWKLTHDFRLYFSDLGWVWLCGWVGDKSIVFYGGSMSGFSSCSLMVLWINSSRCSIVYDKVGDEGNSYLLV